MAPRPRQLILRLLLGAGGAPLAVRDAARACALFAIPANGVRVALVRLAAAGLVEPVGRGAYRLGPNASTLAADVAAWRDANARTRDWTGSWIAVHVGALGRSNRVALRARVRALELLGLRELDRGLHVRPDNLVGGVAAVRQRLTRLGLERGAAVFQAAGFDADRERRARSLWNGTALARGYRATRARLERWLANAYRHEPDAAARESFLLGNEAIRQLVFDPLLPRPLIDEEARAAFVDTVIRFDAAGQAIWKYFLHGDAVTRRAPTPRRATTRTALEAHR
jgi:phenylacetic acid degradation operon negative regulatory protein